MNILIYAHFAGSPEMGMVFGHYYLAREWVRMGHRVTIVTASYVHTRKVNPIVTKRYTTDCIDGIEYVFVRCPAYDPARNVGRAWNILVFTLWSHFFRPQREPDLVISSSHHTLTSFTAYRMARRYGARFVFEVRDLWPLSILELGTVSKSHPFIRLLQQGEDFALKNADRTVSVLPNAQSYFCSRGMRADRYLFLPNGADLHPVSEDLSARQREQLLKFKRQHRKLLAYTGSFGKANNLDALVEALPGLAPAGIGVVLVGSGPEEPALKQLAVDLGMINHILFLGPINKAAVPACLALMDIAYLGLQDKPLFRFGISPTKINDYLLAGLPVVLAVAAPTDAESAGPLVIKCRPGDPEAIAEAVVGLSALEGRELAEGRTEARDWLEENRDYRKLARRFLDGL